MLIIFRTSRPQWSVLKHPLLSYLSIFYIVVINCRAFSCQCDQFVFTQSEIGQTASLHVVTEKVCNPSPSEYQIQLSTVSWGKNLSNEVQTEANYIFKRKECYILRHITMISNNYFCVCSMRRNVLMNGLFICSLTTNLCC